MSEVNNKREDGLRIMRAQRIAKRRSARILPVPRKGDNIDVVLLKRGLLNEKYSVNKNKKVEV